MQYLPVNEATSPIDTVLSVVRDLAEEASGVVPRLVRRTRDQIAVGVTLVERLTGCGSPGTTDAEEPISPVASIVRHDAVADLEDDLADVAPIGTAAKKAPAKKSAAKKAPAKKSPAKKAPAKKAAAKKAPAKKAAAKKAPAKKAAAKKAPAASAAGASASALSPVTTPPPADVVDAVPAAADLPIAGYDILAASQVIARLDGMDAGDLDLIRRYEAANRNRRTILGRVGQLLRPQG